MKPLPRPIRCALLAFMLAIAFIPQNAFAATLVQPNSSFNDIFVKILTNEITPKNKTITITIPGQQFTGTLTALSGSVLELKTTAGLSQIIAVSDIQAVSGEFGQ